MTSMVSYSKYHPNGVSGLPDARKREFTSRAKISPPSSSVAHIVKIHDRHVSLKAAQGKIDMGRLTAEHQANLQKAADAIADGTATPDSIGTVTLESLRSEWEMQSAVLDTAVKKNAEAGVKHVHKVIEAIIEGLSRLEDTTEKAEQKNCNEWNVPFEPSPVLKSITHARMLAEQTLADGTQYGYGVGASPMSTLSAWFSDYANFQ